MPSAIPAAVPPSADDRGTCCDSSKAYRGQVSGNKSLKNGTTKSPLIPHVFLTIVSAPGHRRRRFLRRPAGVDSGSP
jgi:hypothetical protein